MIYTARNLITDSYYLSGIVQRDTQEVSGDQIFNGQRLLNGLLAIKTLDNKLIPYYKEHTFIATYGIKKYFIPKLIAAETVTFLLNEVRYVCSPISRKYFFGCPQAVNVFSLPLTYHLERTNVGSNIYLYFLPDKTYPFTIWGKFMFEVTELDTNLTPVYDNEYLMYLRYALAELICCDYNFAFTQQKSDKLKELETNLIYESPKDMSGFKVSTLRKDSGLNYGTINLSNGWTVA